MYVGVSLLISTILFAAIQMGLELVTSSVLSVSFAVYMTVNFHHYVVDTIIWRRKQVAPAAGPDPLPV
jgi:hypothetical protein